jgi:DNA-binding beta-propeller fold protein YncE
MKKLVFLGTLGGILILLLVSPVFSILSLRFEREFGGLGTEKGKFGEKISLVFDQEGNIYLLDTNNARVQVLGLNREWIREITSQKEKVTLHSPQDLAVDPKGNLYLVDWNSYPVPRTEKPRIYEYLACIYIFDREGNYLRTITLGEVGKRKGLQPAEVMVDEDGQYTLAIKRGHTRKLKIAVDQESNIFLLDPGANLITKYNFKGEKILSFGKYGDGEGELDDPSDLVVDKEGDVYVADTGNHRIVKFSGEGKYLFSFGQKGRGGAEFTEPFYLAISSQYLFVKDKVQTEVKFEEHPFLKKEEKIF